MSGYISRVAYENLQHIREKIENLELAITRAEIDNERLNKELTDAMTPGLFTLKASREAKTTRLIPIVTASNENLANLKNFKRGLADGFSDYIDWHRVNERKFTTIMNKDSSKEYLGKLASIHSSGGGSGMTGGSNLGKLVYTFSKNGIDTEKEIDWNNNNDRIFLKFSDYPPPSAPPAANQGGGRRRTRRHKHKRRAPTKKRHGRRRV
jgi:hypothetical protein